jgi:hypothetical protein
LIDPEKTVPDRRKLAGRQCRNRVTSKHQSSIRLQYECRTATIEKSGQAARRRDSA